MIFLSGDCSLDPIRKYDGETISLELPGDMTISEIDWISVYDLETNKNFGSVLIPNGLNVPPSLIQIQVTPNYCAHHSHL